MVPFHGDEFVVEKSGLVLASKMRDHLTNGSFHRLALFLHRLDSKKSHFNKTKILDKIPLILLALVRVNLVNLQGNVTDEGIQTTGTDNILQVLEHSLLSRTLGFAFHQGNLFDFPLENEASNLG